MEFSKPPTNFIDVGHSRIAHRTLGCGPDVLFIHGWPLNGATWRNVVPRLADDFTCHVIDLPEPASPKPAPTRPSISCRT
jgi:pimeloyl-ACP methyl ester carboxylesterase